MRRRASASSRPSPARARCRAGASLPCSASSAGGPTFLGTVLGRVWVNSAVSVAFLTLAAGSILYVVIELLNVNRGFGFRRLVMWGILVGLLAGFFTDWVLVAAGA